MRSLVLNQRKVRVCFHTQSRWQQYEKNDSTTIYNFRFKYYFGSSRKEYLRIEFNRKSFDQ